MIPGISVGILAIFNVEVYNEHGTVYETGPFTNMMLNSGLALLDTYSLADMALYINVGDGTSDPNPNQTGLDNRLYSTNVLFNSQEDDYYSSFPVFRGYKRVFQFPIGSCTGDFTEVGASRGNNSQYLNRQRIKNSVGYNVIVRVKSDEGLRLTCDLRLYPKDTQPAYSQIYSINLNGATAGSIILSNGVTTQELTYAQITNLGQAKQTLENWLGVGSITNVLLLDNLYYLFAHPLNTADLQLSIQSHTLTGGSGPPSLIINQIFKDCVSEGAFTFNDDSNGTTPNKTFDSYWPLSITGMNKITMKLAASSTTMYNGWGYYPYGVGNNIMESALGSVKIAFITQANAIVFPTSIAKTKAATASDLSWIKEAYCDTGKFGASDQVVVGMCCYATTADTVPTICIVKFNEPITITPSEELRMSFKFAWGGV